MKSELSTTGCNHPNGNPNCLCRDGGRWHLTFEGRPAGFKHELGALYVACLLWEPPTLPLHAVMLALRARRRAGRGGGEWEPQEVAMGLAQAEVVRGLWRRQRELERELADPLTTEPVRAEAARELDELTERLRNSPWLSHHGAERCERAVAWAMKRFHARLAKAVDRHGQPDAVLRGFAEHLTDFLLGPSGHGGEDAITRDSSVLPGCFIYMPPKGVVWHGSEGQSKVSSLKSKVSSRGRVPAGGPEDPRAHPVAAALRGKHQARATLGSSALSLAALGLALLLTGCAGSRPLHGGQAMTARDAHGLMHQTLVQAENPAQASRQEQDTIRVRTYVVPAEQSREQKAESRKADSQLSALSSELLLTDREESHSRAELGAAQKDTARELGARLSSLKGIVWVGVGLFVFGLASLFWPPLKAIIGSVTTSAALAAGGLALIVLPSLLVGHELLLLGGVGAVVGLWFLAHRHGQLSSLKSKV